MSRPRGARGEHTKEREGLIFLLLKMVPSAEYILASVGATEHLAISKNG